METPMQTDHAVEALSALAQGTRLETFRLLVKHEPAGLAAGDVARAMGVPQNTMSSHLRVLAQAGLVSGERQSRSIVYRARLDRFRDLTLHLIQDCCGGDPSLCGSLVADLTPSCTPQETANACC
jgi:ArsR family transcriptional regulator